jgi:hypothetical protein
LKYHSDRHINKEDSLNNVNIFGLANRIVHP